MSKHVSAAGSQPALSRLPLQAAALLAGLALAAGSHLPSSKDSASATTKEAAAPAAAQTAPAPAPASNLEVTATMTLSCVPTKEAQALGLVRTEEVQAVYKMPPDNQPGDAVVELKFGNKEYTLHEGPAASGSRYVTSDALSPRHQVFSWPSKRNEAIIAGLVPASGVNEVVDGPLLYRCLEAN